MCVFICNHAVAQTYDMNPDLMEQAKVQRDTEKDTGTANLKLIDARYHDFNGFSVVMCVYMCVCVRVCVRACACHTTKTMMYHIYIYILYW
jgi:hypothetical protein